MSNTSNLKSNEQVIVPEKDRELAKYTKGTVITGVISMTAMIVVSLFVCHPQVRAYYICMTLFGFPIWSLLCFRLGFFFYRTSGSILKRFNNKWIDCARLATSLLPIWSFALMIVISIYVEGIKETEDTLAYITNDTVSVDEVADFKDHQSIALGGCTFRTVYFRTTPEVVDRLIHLHPYQKKWPYDDNCLKYSPEVIKEQIDYQLNTSPPKGKGWPDIYKWDGVEILQFQENHDHPPQSYTLYSLITDKKHRQVILSRDHLSP